jgi:release factor glutamine methyltransferase
VAVDVSRRALLAARLNAYINGVKVEPRRGDLFAAVAGQRFDLIVANPPYVPGGELPTRGPARAWEAGPAGRAFLDRICAEAPRHLRPGGVLLLCQSTICGERETLDALRRHGLDAAVVFRHVGSLGPLMRAREPWLRSAGLLKDEHDEVIVVRAQLPGAGVARRRAGPGRLPGSPTSPRASRCSPPGA